MPHVIYGCALWIFQAYPEIRLGAHPKRPYGSVLIQDQQTKKPGIATLFNNYMRMCCGARLHTSSTAILVRLGQMPLHYKIAFHALCAFHQIIHGYKGEEMQRCFEVIYGDAKAWDKSIKYTLQTHL